LLFDAVGCCIFIFNVNTLKYSVLFFILCLLQQIITQDLSKDPASNSSPGEMHVSLCYHPTADRFTVTILQARNIKVEYIFSLTHNKKGYASFEREPIAKFLVISFQAPNTATPDSYVRLTLFNQTRAVKTKRTGKCKI